MSLNICIPFYLSLTYSRESKIKSFKCHYLYISVTLYQQAYVSYWVHMVWFWFTCWDKDKEGYQTCRILVKKQRNCHLTSLDVISWVCLCSKEISEYRMWKTAVLHLSSHKACLRLWGQGNEQFRRGHQFSGEYPNHFSVIMLSQANHLGS